MLTYFKYTIYKYVVYALKYIQIYIYENISKIYIVYLIIELEVALRHERHNST